MSGTSFLVFDFGPVAMKTNHQRTLFEGRPKPGAQCGSAPRRYADPPCVNLRERFGDRFQIARDETYAAENGAGGRVDDPWLFTLPCAFGVICPWGPGRLAFSSNSRGAIANRVAALPFVRVEQDADDGITVSFDVGRFHDIARIVKPRRKRRLTKAQRQSACARLAKYAFSAARQFDFGDQIPAKSVRDGSEHVQATPRAVEAAVA